MKNLNLLFNKVYYSKLNTVNFIDFDSNNTVKKAAASSELCEDIEVYNRQLCSVVFDHKRDCKCLSKDIAPQQFLAEIMYPGLIIGSGNPHGAQLCDNDINNGFSFDYVSGQPYIPGSSVKGVLRSCFKDFPDAVSEIISCKFPHFTNSIKALEKEIFEGIDIFFDAVIYSGDKYGKILDTDNITPHPNEIKAPTPILVLKLIPGVRLMFAFRLYNGLLSAEEKLELFITLLSVFGVGAKTNTGYGRLKHTENKNIINTNQMADDTSRTKDEIVCIDCGKTYRLNDFEKDKIINEGWRIIRCKECSVKRKQQRNKR